MQEAARALIKRAHAARRGGDAVGALALYRAARDQSDGDLSARAHSLRHIAELMFELEQDKDARVALDAAEALYRGPVSDTLSLANTLRLRALLDGDAAHWMEARALYVRAAAETGLDLAAALAECDRRLTR